MIMSNCDAMFITLAAIAVSVALGFVAFAGYNYLVEKCRERQFKLPNFSVQTAFATAVACLLLIGFTVHYNTTEWKPCGQDSIAKALENTPVQPVVASVSNCGCWK